ncbi:MAG: hypothetical protein SVV03_02615 [Candidatus Nanohaloarchaea archaeon]|nr:hypothetical protein [Candidatus Nanohaloarchaea archaeon]
MSVSQKPQAPRVPDWEADEILDYLAQQYDTPEERREELGVKDGELVSMAHALEPGEPDMERQMKFLEMMSEIDEEYQSNHCVNEEDAQYKDDAKGKVIYYGTMRDPDNEECWIMISEVEYVEE